MKLIRALDIFIKLAEKQNTILENRIKLIDAMKNALSVIDDEKDKDYIESIILDIIEDEEANLAISLNDNNTVSYSRSADTIDNEAKRVKTTLGRYIKRTFSSPIKDNSLSKFTTEVLKQISTEESLDKEIKELSEKDIMDFYESNDDSKSCGGLSSCMTGEAATYTELYALNPDKVKLITFGNRSRALLWTTDDGERVLDRYYPAQSKYGELLRKWAKNKGYILRNNPDSLDLGGDVKLSDNKQHVITLKHNNVFPYLDTFKYGKIKDDKVAISNYASFGNIIFDSLNGEYTESYCFNCNRDLSGDNRIEHDNNFYCDNCFSELFYECAKCKKTYEQNDGLEYINDQMLCNDCFSKNYFHCENCSDATGNKEAIIVNDHSYYCPDCVESEDIKICDKCDKHYGERQLTVVYDEDNHQQHYCDKDIQAANRCNDCFDYFSYKLEHGYCRNCKPDLYSEQLSLPFVVEEYDRCVKSFHRKY